MTRVTDDPSVSLAEGPRRDWGRLVEAMRVAALIHAEQPSGTSRTMTWPSSKMLQTLADLRAARQIEHREGCLGPRIEAFDARRPAAVKLHVTQSDWARCWLRSISAALRRWSGSLPAADGAQGS